MKLPQRTFNKKYEDQHGRCFYCGTDLSECKIEIDHILSFSKTGNGSVSNLCLSCKECNRKKSDKTLHDFKKLMQDDCSDKLIRGMFYFEFLKLGI